MTTRIPLRPAGYVAPPVRAAAADPKRAVLARELAAAEGLWTATQEAEALAAWPRLAEEAGEAVRDPARPETPEGHAQRVSRALQEDMTARLETAPSAAAAQALARRFAELGARETGAALRTERDLRRRRDAARALDALEGLVDLASDRPEMLTEALASGRTLIAGLAPVAGEETAAALRARFAAELPERVVEAALARDADEARALLATPAVAQALGDRAGPLRARIEQAAADRQAAQADASRAGFETHLAALARGETEPLDPADLAGLDEAVRGEFARRQEAVLRQNETVERLLRLPPEAAEAELRRAEITGPGGTGRVASPTT